jgi:hypothetical protein
MNENESKDMVKLEETTRFEIVELDDMDLDIAAGGRADNTGCTEVNGICPS